LNPHVTTPSPQMALGDGINFCGRGSANQRRLLHNFLGTMISCLT